jgi:entericidin B
MKKLVFISFILVSFSSLIACNTVGGLGKDMQKGGQAVQKAADKHK